MKALLVSSIPNVSLVWLEFIKGLKLVKGKKGKCLWVDERNC